MQIPYSFRVAGVVLLMVAVVSMLLIDREDFLRQGRVDVFPSDVPPCNKSSSSPADSPSPMQLSFPTRKGPRVTKDQKDSVTYYTVVDDPFALDPV